MLAEWVLVMRTNALAFVFLFLALLCIIVSISYLFSKLLDHGGASIRCRFVASTGSHHRQQFGSEKGNSLKIAA